MIYSCISCATTSVHIIYPLHNALLSLTSPSYHPCLQFYSVAPHSSRHIRTLTILDNTGGEGQYTQWVHCEFVVGSETICLAHTQQVNGHQQNRMLFEVLWRGKNSKSQKSFTPPLKDFEVAAITLEIFEVDENLAQQLVTLCSLLCFSDFSELIGKLYILLGFTTHNYIVYGNLCPHVCWCWWSSPDVWTQELVGEGMFKWDAGVGR